MSAATVLQQLPFTLHVRYRRALYSSSVSIVSKGLAFATSLITVPLAVRYLGPERYGIWIALSSFIAVASHIDLGLTAGLLHAVATAHGRDDRRAAAEACSSTFFLLAGLAVVAVAGFWAVDRWLLFSRLIHTSPDSCAEVRLAFWALALLFVFKLPLGMIDPIQAGYQEGYRSNWWAALGNAASLVFLLAAFACRAGLPVLVLAAAGGVFLSTTANLANEVLRVRPWLRPRLALVSWTVGSQLFRRGVLFFLAGLVVILTTQLPLVIIGAQLGPRETAVYGVAARLLSVVPVLVSIFTVPLWPAYTEAATRGENAWTRKTFRISVSVCGAAAVTGCGLFAAIYRPLISHWARPDMVPPFPVIVPSCVFAALTTMKWATWMFLNGHNRLAPLAIHPLPAVLAGAICAWVAARYVGLAGIVSIFSGIEAVNLLIQWRAVRALLGAGRAGVQNPCPQNA
ncbi:MAG TPA: lipopolysaccharide biosynthesis protein [Bryobacteraceae bacterium]|nr:lipopolysaccharide biosynthesis protein [Bryobacteraceae bacterium]